MSNPVLDAYAALGKALDGLRKAMDDPANGFSDSELLALLRTHHRVEARLDALGVDLVTYADMRDLAHRTGASSTSAWLSGVLKLHPSTAADRVRTARAMETVCPWTYQNLADGDISYEQASAIASVVTDLPKGSDDRQRGRAERYLLDRAPTSNALELRKLHKRVDDLIDPDGLLGREATAQRRRDLTVKSNHDGTQTVRWTDTDERIAKFKAALNPLATPQPAPDGTQDPRAPGQRRADAMADLVERSLRLGNLPSTRGHRAHIVVTISEENLRSETGFGTTTTGETLTAEAVRRIACDANIHSLHVDGHGVPLKLGRSQRFASSGQWLALVARDGGCVGPNCTRPPEWTQAHHIDWWEHLGPTDLDNLCLVCDFHHDQVHHRGWEIVMSADGHPEFVPPEHVDPFQRPIRNTHWHIERGSRPSQRAA
ncbi:MAG: DUF222 domain-containing protein [Sporichthyaceae bacterium]